MWYLNSWYSEDHKCSNSSRYIKDIHTVEFSGLALGIAEICTSVTITSDGCSLPSVLSLYGHDAIYFIFNILKEEWMSAHDQDHPPVVEQWLCDQIGLLTSRCQLTDYGWISKWGVERRRGQLNSSCRQISALCLWRGGKQGFVKHSTITCMCFGCIALHAPYYLHMWNICLLF